MWATSEFRVLASIQFLDVVTRLAARSPTNWSMPSELPPGAGYAPVYAGYHYCIWGVNTTSVGIIDTIDGSRHIIWSSTWGIDVGALRASAELLEHGIIRPVFDAYGEPFPSTTEQNPVGAWTPALPATPPPHRRPGEKRLGPHLPPPRAK